MFRIDWSNPKVTLSDIEQVIQPYLGDNYDGLQIENNYLYVRTNEPITGTQEDYILDVVYSMNQQPREVVTQNEKLGTPPITDDKRVITTINRIPLGYTIAPTGQGDNIENGTYGNGSKLRLDANNNSIDLQFLGHWYGVGGRVIWENATLDDEMNATLIAPATEGFTSGTGDFNLIDIGYPSVATGKHIIIPVAPGTGNIVLDTTLKKPNTQILKCVPVPSTGNQGWFDYDSSTNTLSINALQQGNVNLYDFPVNIFRFCNCVFGRKQDGAESVLETTDVVGKLLYNSWIIRFTLNAVTPNVRCGVIITTAIKKNI